MYVSTNLPNQVPWSQHSNSVPTGKGGDDGDDDDDDSDGDGDGDGDDGDDDDEDGDHDDGDDEDHDDGLQHHGYGRNGDDNSSVWNKNGIQTKVYGLKIMNKSLNRGGHHLNTVSGEVNGQHRHDAYWSLLSHCILAGDRPPFEPSSRKIRKTICSSPTSIPPLRSLQQPGPPLSEQPNPLSGTT